MTSRKPISSPQVHASLAQDLVHWYQQGHRDLPWRRTQDPYGIWISEIMLQQTTSQAVIPFYERFLKRFPTLKSLASATQEDVYAVWAGLGYYSRARNILKAAQSLSGRPFPKSWKDLIELPGFGPYTSRAVSSFAFGENVGVVDGNVIRCLSRVFDLNIEWWSTKGREIFQSHADALAAAASSSVVNQALMELGATVCTPKSPSCMLCPWTKSCKALKNKTITQRPLQKEKPATEILLWTPWISIQKNKVAMIDNDYAPFLKKSKIFPGKLQRLSTPPKTFDFKHTITRYAIYTQLQTQKPLTDKSKHTLFELSEFSQLFPYSLYAKALSHAQTPKTPRHKSSEQKKKSPGRLAKRSNVLLDF